MTRKPAALALMITFAAVAVGAVAALGGFASGAATQAATQKKPIRFEQHDLFIEYNASAGDAGLQLNLDGENWKQFTLLDPNGNVLADLNAQSRLGQPPNGLSELFFEASEPPFTQVPFSEFKRLFPEGVYRFRGRAGNGREMVASDRLSHLIPGAPHVTFPTKGARVDPNGFKVTWEPVTSPAGVKIVSYQVIVNQGGRELSMYLPPSVTSVTIPAEFLKPGAKTGGEVLAREESGNQTITELPSFRTK
jgi:hypothetical protein